MFIVDGWLCGIKEDTEYISINKSLNGIANNLYRDCHSLKNAIWYGSIDGTTNVETIIVPHLTGWIQPSLTLENIVLLDTVEISEMKEYWNFFGNVTGVTIYVEGNEEDLRWNDNFPGWNNGNKVVYSDNWHWSNFYDFEGNLIFSGPCRNSEVIRRPAIEDMEDERHTYEFVGWDIDADGIVDSIPATSIVDVNVYPVFEQSSRQYTVTFKDADTGEIYSQKKMGYGELIVTPPDPEKDGAVFNGWNGYKEGMTVDGDITITAKWYIQVVESVGKTVLKTAVDAAKAEYVKERYTSESWSDFAEKLANAEKVLANPNATQTDVDRAALLLNRAIESLIYLSPYDDVVLGEASHEWFYNEVIVNYYAGIMKGLNDNTFGPFQSLSRAQFALILYRMEGEPIVNTEKSFFDIVGDEWYGEAVLWAAENGIVTGYLDGNFGPVDMITREQMAVMMYRYAKYLGQDVATEDGYSDFKDAASVSEFAGEAINWAVGAKIIRGKDFDNDGNSESIEPQGNTSRAECAIIIERFRKYYN